MGRSLCRGPKARLVLPATVCITIALLALLALPTAVYAKPRTTQEVLDHQIDALCPDDPAEPIDLDEFMKDYHKRTVAIVSDVVGVFPPRITKGFEDNRAGFEGLFQAVGGNACDLVVLQQAVDGPYAYLHWVWPDFGGLAPGFDSWGTDIYLIKGGQIRLRIANIVHVPRAQ